MGVRRVWDRVDEAKQHLENLSVEEVRREQEEGSAVLVDIRDLRELLLRGAIPGAVHAPRGMLEFWIDPESGYHREEFDPSRRYILYCAAGGRSALAAATMKEMGYGDVAHLEAGFEGWAAAGGEIDDVAARSKWVRRDAPPDRS
jgi:rhodanese-related sulfurtransferase